MRSAVLEPDASGNFVLSSYIFATARDYARFGLLYYNDGKWKANRSSHLNLVKHGNLPLQTHREIMDTSFGLGTDHHYPHLPNFPDVPADLYYADGFAVQEIYIIPQRNW
jgi:CubicO group peptidase (beta-lactamase class C family)